MIRLLLKPTLPWHFSDSEASEEAGEEGWMAMMDGKGYDDGNGNGNGDGDGNGDGNSNGNGNGNDDDNGEGNGEGNGEKNGEGNGKWNGKWNGKGNGKGDRHAGWGDGPRAGEMVMKGGTGRDE